MRKLTKILLSACTLCAFGQAQHTARADTHQPDEVPPPPDPPATNPPPTPPPSPTETPSEPSSPTNTPSENPATSPAPNPPVPSTTPTEPTEDTSQAVPPPPPPTTTTQTTTTTTTYNASPVTDDYSYAWSDPALQSRVGVSVILGGGAMGFTEKIVRNTTSDVGGLWDLRVTIGSHVPLAVDLSYVGSATSIGGLPTGNSGTLIGTAAEGALRWNILPHSPWTPYLFGGVGWQRYDVTGTHVSLADSGMNDHDNLLEFPMGAGLVYRMNGFVFDVRGTYRYTMDNNLVLNTTVPTTISPSSSDFVKLNSWEASAALGYEF